MMLVDN